MTTFKYNVELERGQLTYQFAADGSLTLYSFDRGSSTYEDLNTNDNEPSQLA